VFSFAIAVEGVLCPSFTTSKNRQL